MDDLSVRIKVPARKSEISEISKALESEADFKKRATISMHEEPAKDGLNLIIDISSSDISSLHAATGSILRAVKVIISVKKASESR